MNSLIMLIRDLGLYETAVLNALQGEVGLISDLCVGAADVSPKDCFRAVSWVISNKERFKLGAGSGV